MERKFFLGSYLKFLQKFLEPQKPLTIVFDCSNGVAGLVLKRIKSPLNSKFYILNSEPDGNFPAHGPDPLKPGAVKQLQAAVKKYKADFGVIFDADADRVFFVDDKSRFVDPDVVARLLIWHLKPKKVVIDVSAGWLVKNLKSQISNLKIIESKVGHYFIKQKMRAEKADFGAEHSGHYYFRISDSKLRISSESANKSEFYFDSGILAALEVINAVSRLPYTVSDFVDLLPQYYRSGEINIRYPASLAGRQASSVKRQEFLKKIEAYYKLKAKSLPRSSPKGLLRGYKLLKIFHLDGLTMEFENKIGLASRSLGEGWWFNLRFSQTEPLLRLNVEAESRSKLQEEVAILRNKF